MDTYALLSLVITLTASIAYLNHLIFKLPTTIAVMSGALAISFIIIVLEHLGIDSLSTYSHKLFHSVNFHDLLMKGMLSFLLFTGSMSIDFNLLKSDSWIIGSLASFGVIASTILTAFTIYYLLPLLGISLPLIYCFLFGALISPTDPISVLATFKKLGTPKRVNTLLAGESLFNDGVGIVVFITIYLLAFKHEPISISNVTWLFVRQAIGGITYGAIIGYLSNILIKHSTPLLAILITLTIVTGCYAFAQSLYISGPLAMVVAGIFIGNKARYGSAEDKINKTLNLFWDVIDEILNAILFMLIGFELLNIHATEMTVLTAIIAIPLLLLIRLITVAAPVKLFLKKEARIPNIIPILTWGGLRGGLAVALSLSLPDSPHRDIILTMTFAIVTFSIIVQGLTVKKLAPIKASST